MELSETEKLQPGLSIDCVIFGFHEGALKVLVLKMKHINKWALPGGFIAKNKSIDAEASVILKKRTGLENIFLRQFCVFGDLERNSKAHISSLFKYKLIDEKFKPWFNQRFVTIGYYALIRLDQSHKFTPDALSEFCEWHSLDDIPDMIIDHKSIINKALKTLQIELNYQPIGLNLLPKQFTMTELQSVYETILEKKLDRRNFRRKMLNYDILIATNKKRVGGPYKSPFLYEFDLKKYNLALQNGLNTGW
jgi:hypothetical protein